MSDSFFLVLKADASLRSQGKAIIRIEDCKVFTKQEFLGIFG